MKTAKNVFLTSKGGDAYEVSVGWYYALHIILVIYGLGYVASLMQLQNAHVEHTYHKANEHGTLYSQRYVQLYWYALVFIAARIFVFFVVQSMLLYRKYLCCGGKVPVCTIMWSGFLVALVIVELMVLSILGHYYGKCNGLDQLDNPCNDLKWCCAPEIFNNPANKCSNTIACSPALTLASMVPDVDFVALFAVSVVFVAMDLFFLLLPLGLWMTASHTVYEEGEDDDGGDEALIESGIEYQRRAPPPPPPLFGQKQQKSKSALLGNKRVVVNKRLSALKAENDKM
jgi:hypothetical protein